MCKPKPGYRRAAYSAPSARDSTFRVDSERPGPPYGQKMSEVLWLVRLEQHIAKYPFAAHILSNKEILRKVLERGEEGEGLCGLKAPSWRFLCTKSRVEKLPEALMPLLEPTAVLVSPLPNFMGARAGETGQRVAPFCDMLKFPRFPIGVQSISSLFLWFDRPLGPVLVSWLRY